MLVELRGELHEVAVDRSAALALEGSFGEHAVEAVTELMEHGEHLVDGEERGGVGGGFGEVAHVVDDRTHYRAVGVDPRGLEFLHPCALTLAGAGEVVGHEHGEMVAFGILDVVDLDIGMILGRVGHRLESEAVELVGHGEDTLGNGIDGEVGTDCILVEIVFLLTHLLGEVAVVPGLDLEGVAHGVGERLHLSHFLGHLSLGGLPDAEQQLLGSLRSGSHLVGSHERSEIGEAHDGSFLGAGFDDLLNDGEIVVVAALSVAGVSAPHFLAEVAVVGILEDRQTRGSVESEDPFALFAALLGLGSGVGHCGSGDAGEVGLIVDYDLESIVGVEQIFVEFDVEIGEAVVHLLELRLLVVGEESAVEGEVAVDVLDCADLIVGEAERVAGVVEGLDAAEEAVVHHHLIGESAVLREDRVGDGAKLGSRVGLGERHEHRHDALECGGEIVKGEDGVVESRSLGVVDNRVDGGASLGHAGLEGGHVVGDFDFLEGRDLIGGVVRLHERVLPFALATRSHRKSGGHRQSTECHSDWFHVDVSLNY